MVTFNLAHHGAGGVGWKCAPVYTAEAIGPSYDVQRGRSSLGELLFVLLAVCMFMSVTCRVVGVCGCEGQAVLYGCVCMHTTYIHNDIIN